MRIIFLIFCALLFSCGTKDISYNYPDNPDYARKIRAGTAFSKGDLVIYGKKKEKSPQAKLAENFEDDDFENEHFENFGIGNRADAGAKKSLAAKSNLWRATVEVVSQLFPIAIINSESGIITTEWYQESPNDKERVKISALIKGAEPKNENLHITIFRQKKLAQKNSGNSWQDLNREDSSSGGLSAKLLHDKILSLAQKN